METPKTDTRTIPNSELPKYEPPKVTVMDENQILQSFQMTAAQISAAGCWWSGSHS